MSEEQYVIKNFPVEFSMKYKRMRLKLAKNLILYHPCMRKTLDLWHREFR